MYSIRQVKLQDKLPLVCTVPLINNIDSEDAPLRADTFSPLQLIHQENSHIESGVECQDYT